MTRRLLISILHTMLVAGFKVQIRLIKWSNALGDYRFQRDVYINGVKV